jgi:1-acyl-sn-glycerol-3-phosphate acyltransferase
VVLLTGMFSSAAFLFLPAGGPTLTRIASAWGRWVLSLCGVKVEVHGAEHLGTHPSVVAMANHTSHTDVMALFGYLEKDMTPVAKRELAVIPVFGWILWAGAAIMIDRRDRKKAVQSLREAARVIRGGRSVLMFAEGTRTPPGVLGPLKKGPFHLALEAGVPVVPIGVRGSGDILAPHDWKIRPGTISLHVGPPISTEGLKNNDHGRQVLMEKVRLALIELASVTPVDRDAPAAGVPDAAAS